MRADGWTQPIVCRPPDAKGIRIIIDGEHRWRASEQLVKQWGSLVPVVTLHKDQSQCIAATVRHNKARGSHGVEAMAKVVRRMEDEGCAPDEIAEMLGLTASEYQRLTTSDAIFAMIQGGRDGVTSE